MSGGRAMGLLPEHQELAAVSGAELAVQQELILPVNHVEQFACSDRLVPVYCSPSEILAPRGGLWAVSQSELPAVELRRQLMGRGSTELEARHPPMPTMINPGGLIYAAASSTAALGSRSNITGTHGLPWPTHAYEAAGAIAVESSGSSGWACATGRRFSEAAGPRQRPGLPLPLRALRSAHPACGARLIHNRSDRPFTTRIATAHSWARLSAWLRDSRNVISTGRFDPAWFEGLEGGGPPVCTGRIVAPMRQPRHLWPMRSDALRTCWCPWLPRYRCTDAWRGEVRHPS